ncbi:sensor histidine kinase [Scytonema millei]|uniref:histidine kinase n=1 Tax=Scytonema millei VB511283 TaxID=1245923 RepID=A0A9X5E3U6_9CYAN|nr:sensor histidine kinase [Scytonema millei]NHC34641.1 sensor histidine kinase [Scytonema millei VB511283]
MKLLSYFGWQRTTNELSHPASRRMPMQLVLAVPFMLHIMATVGLVGYFSFKNGQQAVDRLADRLIDKAGDRIQDRLSAYFAIPKQINQINLDAVELGLLDLKDFERTGHYFWKQMQVFNVGYINYANIQGEFIGVERLNNGHLLINETLKTAPSRQSIYTTDNRGNRQSLKKIIGHIEPVQQEGWYADAAKAGKPVWSSIYQWRDKPEVLSISSSYPVRDRQQKFIGVIGVDLILSQISDYLHELPVSSSEQIFIIEQNGLLVASSSSDRPFAIVDRQARRIHAVDSSDPVIKQTTEFLLKKFNNLNGIQTEQHFELKIKGVRQFVCIKPWKDNYGLNWLIAIVLPESDFMQDIHDNNRTTAVLCLTALIITTALSTLTSRWITIPIRRLSRASQVLAQQAAIGEFTHTNLNRQSVENIDELAVLSDSFNRMAAQLQISFTEITTKNLEVEQALVKEKELSELKSRFVSMTFHEFRTPLTAILSSAELLEDYGAIWHEEKKRHHLQRIQTQVKHMTSLLNDVLVMGKAEAGKLECQVTPIDLFQWCRSLVEEVQLITKTHEIVFHSQGKAEIVRLDEKLLRHILTNLLSNAIKYSPSATEVNFDLIWEPNQIIFQVRDRGIGIPASDRENLFDSFHRATNVGNIAGTGLGLAIVKKAVETHQGEIWFETQVGMGTKFIVAIPLVS